MIKAVIFDFNGVFAVREFFSESFSRDFGVAKEEFLAALKQIMDIVRLPGAPRVYDLWRPYLEKWGVKMTEGELLDYWILAEKLVPEMVDLAKELKAKRLEIYILSNNFRERTEYYLKKWPELFALFDRVYFSWQTGLLKSDSRAYTHLLEENALEASECVFFDDSPKNIELAQSLGIKAQKYEDAESAKLLLAYV